MMYLIVIFFVVRYPLKKSAGSRFRVGESKLVKGGEKSKKVIGEKKNA